MTKRPVRLRAGLSQEELEIATRFDAACGDLSDAEVARIIGDSEANVRAYRRAERRLPTMAVARLCAATGVRANAVVNGPADEA